MSAFKILPLLSLLIFLSFLPIFSQGYHVRLYTEDDGLPNLTVNDIVQDHSGRLWFATRTSIARYDGSTWNTFSGRQGVPDFNYFRLKVDASGVVWAIHRLASNPVIYFKDTAWHTLPLPPNLSSIRIDNTISSVVVQTLDKKTVLALGTRKLGVYLWQQNRWHHLQQNTGLPSNTINSLAVFNNRLYIATDLGLASVNIQKMDKIHIRQMGLPTRTIHGLAPDKQKGLWILGDTWLGRYHQGVFTTLAGKLNTHFFKNYRFVFMRPITEHEIYFGDPYSIFHFDTKIGKVEKIGQHNGLNESGAYSIFQDREKNLWFAGSRGVCKVSNLPFDNFYTRDGLLDNEVTALLEVKPGHFIMGHNTGFTYYDGQRFVKRKLPASYYVEGLPPRVMDIKQDSHGTIWAAVSHAGIVAFTPTGKITRYAAEKGYEIPGTALWIDENDSIFAGGNGGLFKLYQQRFIPVQGSYIRPLEVRKLYQGEDGHLNVATSNSGLWQIRGSEWLHFPSGDEKTANSVFALYQDKQQRFWVGTLAGLYIKRGNGIYKYQQGNLTINRPIYSINETPDSCLWFGTDHGVFRWDGRQLINYTVQHGLAGYETNRAANITDHQGRIWIGTAQGLSRFKNIFPRQQIPPPLAELAFFKTSGQRLSPGKKNILKPWMRDLEIHFNGISFIDEKRLLFSSKLEGLESKWSGDYASPTRMVNYQNLPPGTYRFHLKVKNTLDVWSKEVISADIIIPRAFYKTWWFYILALLIFGFIVNFTGKHYAKRKYTRNLEQKVIERSAQLKASEERYHNLFMESKDAIFFTKKGGKLLDINPAGLELLGFRSKNEIMGTNFSRDIFMDLKQRKEFLRELGNYGFVKDYELTLKKKDNSQIFVEITATSVRAQAGDMVGFRGIVRDITEKKSLENQLEQATKMEAIGSLAGGVAHDLNNILSGLINYPELLLMKMPADTPLKKYILPIKETGKKAATIVQDLVTLARRSVIITEPLNVNEIVSEALETPFYEKVALFHPLVKFKTQLAKSPWPLTGSESQLTRILLNLCSNAAEALPSGGKVSINTRNQELAKSVMAYECISPGKYVVLSVKDNGEPLTATESARIFEPFFTKKVMGRSGTGLGMAVVWAIMKEHNGHITLQSHKGEGTTIELYFPAAKQDSFKKSKTSRKPVKTDRKETILVVDDVEEQRKLALEILQRCGYIADSVASGEEAIKYMEQNQVDLIWLDMMMDPGIDGLETYEKIIKIHPGQKAIIVSGYSETPRVKKALKLGVAAYVKKPYSIEKITQVLRRELESP